MCKISPDSVSDTFICTAQHTIFDSISSFFDSEVGRVVVFGLGAIMILFLPFLIFVKSTQKWQSPQLWQKLLVLISVYVGYYMGLLLAGHLFERISSYAGPFFARCGFWG